MSTCSTARLSDLCELIKEPVKPGARKDACYLGLEHLATRRLLRIGEGNSSEMRSTTHAFQHGDVLYGKLRPYLDKAVLADKAGVCTTELLILRAKKDVDPRFLVGVIHSPEFIRHAIAGTTGVQHPRTSWHHIREFRIPTLTPDEQRRVADLLFLVYEVILRSEKVVKKGQALKCAVMQILFTHGLQGEVQKETNTGPVPKSWTMQPLETLCSKTDIIDLQREGFRIIQYVDVSSVSRESLQIETTSRFRLHEAPGRARKRILKGDVIFATVRPTLLRTAVVPTELHNQVCSTAFCVLRRNPEKTAVGFLRYVVQRRQFIGQLARVETGASYPAVTDSIIKKQMVPTPSLKEQEKIVAVLEVIDRKIDLHRQKQAILEELLKSLLHKIIVREIRIGDLDCSVLSGRFSGSAYER